MIVGPALSSAGRLIFSRDTVVIDAIRVESLSALRALYGKHTWSDAVVEERFHKAFPDRRVAIRKHLEGV